MSKKEFKRPSLAIKEVKDEKVAVANVTETAKPAVEETAKKQFVSYDEMVNDTRGHNFPRKIVPLKQDVGYLANTTIDDNIVTLSVEDLTYVSFAINPKDLERFLLGKCDDRVVKSIRAYNSSNKGLPYLYAALDKNIAINTAVKTNLLEVLDRRLKQTLNVDGVVKGPLRALLTTEYRDNIVDNGSDIGFVFNISDAVAMYVASMVFSTVDVEQVRLNNMIANQFRISNDVLFENGKILAAFSFTNKIGSTLVIKTALENIVGLNTSMSLAKFKSKVDEYLRNNVDTSAHIEYVNFAKLLRTESIAGLSVAETEQAKANQKLISELSGNAGTTGGLNVSLVPLVILDNAFATDRHVFHNSTLNELLKPIPGREGVKKELVARRLGPLLTEDIMSFAVGDNIAILTDVAKLVMTVELGGVKNLRLSVSTTDSYIAYNFTV